jgi:exodeoxyribonuclease VII large subunit
MRPVDRGPGEEKVYSVSEVTARIKEVIETSHPRIWISGEVSNCSRHSSGHTYFTLKDQDSQIRCVLFAGSGRRLSVVPGDGLSFFVHGRLAVYERQGVYQIIVDNLIPAGRGELYLAFNRLKENLEKEGLFDPARKKPLPRFPSRIAAVTSPTGAAIRDFLRVVRSIGVGVEVVIYPVRVQGGEAAGEIAAALVELNRMGGFEVIVLTRGGGSIEDLWAFNEETVARAVAASKVPVVSAVGHEIDFTIADFVADGRAPTPSAAPTLVLEGYLEARSDLQVLMERLYGAVSGRIERNLDFLKGLRTRYGLRRITDRIVRDMQIVDERLGRTERLVRERIRSESARLEGLAARAKALSPQATLSRGYSIAIDAGTGRAVTDAEALRRGDLLKLRFARGQALSRVEGIEEDR